MRFSYWFLRYYKRNSLVLFLIVIVLGFFFNFLYRTAMISFLTDKVKAEILNLRSINKPSIGGLPVSPLSDTSSDSESIVPSRIPKSCFSSDRGCVCYDQYTIVIKDFPLDQCQNIVNGFARF
ncbi:hypothetical protein [Nitrosomonas sp.]|uniref:hypothetical protein n=1 Tax=Nitrosomonas sp. TaxID=42353 RepID=UPI0025EFE7A2|nr:hypothetical protein [Nitrosomonas sp.]MBV6446688.1 hypothetical protein [Nitrosomonas sp.]